MSATKKQTTKPPSAPKRKAKNTPSAPSTQTPTLTPEWQVEFLNRTRLKTARIDARFMEKSLDTYKIERNKNRSNVVHSAKGFVKSFNLEKGPPPGMIFEGGVGTGKTHIAVAILKEVIALGHTGLYYNMVDLLSDIRATYSDSATLTENEIIEEVLAPDLLVLDDLGAERTSGWVNERLYLIVNRRYGSGKPILATTNLSLDELTQKLGERTMSRLCEMCHWFREFPKEDYRKKHMH
jgi:DNA replication protein DnaC